MLPTHSAQLMPMMVSRSRCQGMEAGKSVVKLGLPLREEGASCVSPLEFQKETKAKLMRGEQLWSSAGSDLRAPIRPCASFGNCVSCCEEGSVNSETFIVLIHHRDGTVTHYKAY